MTSSSSWRPERLGLRLLVGFGRMVRLSHREEALPAREDLWRRLDAALVHQLTEMGLEGIVAANGHRYRACGLWLWGQLDMKWPEHPVFPNYGYTITRFNLDGLVAENAEKHGADVLNGVEAIDLVEPPPVETNNWSVRRAWS